MMKHVAFAVATVLFLVNVTVAETPAAFRISHAMQPPKIDGDLNEEIWDGTSVMTDEWISYNPLYGTRMPQRTEVFIAYDERNLYFAFHCLDSEPDKIRTTISKRDNAFNDD